MDSQFQDSSDDVAYNDTSFSAVEAPTKKKRKSIVELDFSKSVDSFTTPDFDTDKDEAEYTRIQLQIAAKEARKAVLDVLFFAAQVVSDNPINMDTIISLVDRFGLSNVNDSTIRTAVKYQVRCGMVTKTGRSYALSALGSANVDDMRGAFSNSFRR